MGKDLYLELERQRFRNRFPDQRKLRAEVLERYEVIGQAIPCLHREDEILLIADEILSIPDSLEGDIVECGVFKGGSTAKLSIVARLTGRKLVACDSFQGLPAPGEDEGYFKQGDLLGTVDEVCDNIAKFGELDSVEIVPGWFHETLPGLRNRKFVLVFEDADLYQSVVCCIENLWPSLQPGCKMFTHELSHPAIRAYSDQAWWMSRFGYKPPYLFRAGIKPSLAYIEKARVEVIKVVERARQLQSTKKI